MDFDIGMVFSMSASFDIRVWAFQHYTHFGCSLLPVSMISFHAFFLSYQIHAIDSIHSLALIVWYILGDQSLHKPSHAISQIPWVVGYMDSQPLQNTDQPHSLLKYSLISSDIAFPRVPQDDDDSIAKPSIERNTRAEFSPLGIRVVNADRAYTINLAQ
ncbi:hypothetical protein J1614_010932 [Plenodomus biglobosus]|nr:hypothetical protein J1614_010932 [Plenodomus biglobosus]